VTATRLSFAALPATDRRRRHAERLAEFGLRDPSDPPNASAAPERAVSRPSMIN
jgi:hypothetical protein